VSRPDFKLSLFLVAPPRPRPLLQSTNFYPAMTEGHHRKVPIDIGTAGLLVLQGHEFPRIASPASPPLKNY